MIGGEPEIVTHLDPILATIAPGVDAAPRTEGRTGPPSSAEQGYLHCGPAGSGHFVKMVHNGIEYGMMAAYAEGFNLLQSRRGLVPVREGHGAETTPIPDPQRYQYDFDLAARSPNSGGAVAVVIASWLLDLTAALAGGVDPQLTPTSRAACADSGEGRWTLNSPPSTTAVPDARCSRRHSIDTVRVAGRG